MNRTMYDDFGPIYYDEKYESLLGRMREREKDKEKYENATRFEWNTPEPSVNSEDEKFERNNERGDSSDSGEDYLRYDRIQERNLENMGRYDENGDYYNYRMMDSAELFKNGEYVYSRQFEFDVHVRDYCDYFDEILDDIYCYPNIDYDCDNERILNWLGAPLEIYKPFSDEYLGKRKKMSNEDFIYFVKSKRWKIYSSKQYADIQEIRFKYFPPSYDFGDEKPDELIEKARRKIKNLFRKKKTTMEKLKKNKYFNDLSENKFIH